MEQIIGGKNTDRVRHLNEYISVRSRLDEKINELQTSNNFLLDAERQELEEDIKLLEEGIKSYVR